MLPRDEVVLREGDDAPERGRRRRVARRPGLKYWSRKLGATVRSERSRYAAGARALRAPRSRCRWRESAPAAMPGANASHARRASVYASSPVAHAAHQMRISCEPAACARSSSARHGIASSCSRSRKKKVSLIVTSSMSVAIARGPVDRVGGKREEVRRDRRRAAPARAPSAAPGAGSAATRMPLSRRTSSATRSSASLIAAARPFERDRRSGRRRSRRSAGSVAAPALRCFARHPVDAEVASSWAIVSPPASRTAPSPSAPSRPIPVSTTRDAGALCACRDAPEQHVGGRPVQRRGRRAVECENAVRPEHEMRRRRARASHAAAARSRLVGEPDRQGHGGVEPRARPSVKPGGDVLDDEDRERESRREAERTVASALRAAGRRADPDHRAAARPGSHAARRRSGARAGDGSRARPRAA